MKKNGGNTLFEEYLWAFVIRGALCLIAQFNHGFD